MKKARIGSIDALSLVDQAVEADLLFSDPEAIHWQRDQLHQASVRVAEHPLLPMLASVDQLKSFYAPLDRRFNLARLAFYLNDEALFERCYVGMNYLLPCFRSAEASWVATRRPGLARLLDGFLGCELFYRADLSPEWQQRLSGTDEWAFAIAVLQGDLQTASRCFLHPGCAEALDFLRGDAEKAHQGFQKLIKRCKKGPVLHSFPALFAQLAALHCGDAMAAMDERYTSSYFPGLQELFQTAARQMLVPHSEKTYELDSTGSLATLFSLVLKPLLVGGQIKAGAVEKARQRWKGQGLHGLLRQLEQPVSPLHWGHGLGRREDWEIWLSALRTRGQVNELPASKAAKATATLRLVWHLDEGTPRPAKEKLNREAWTATTIAWKTLMNKPPDFLSEQDRVVLGKVRRSKDYGGEYFSFGLDSYRALIGHPHLYHKGKPCQLELVPLQLKVRRQGQSLRVETVPALRPGQDFAVYPLGPGKMGLCEVTPSQQALLSLTEQKVDIPLKAQEQLLESLTPWMDKVDLQLPAEVVPEQPGQSQVVVRIQPLGVGLRFELGVRPGGEAGSFCPAGEGPLTLTLKQENRTILVRRDFPQEVAEREKLWRRCQALQEQVQVEAPDVREALEILLELQGSGVRLEWPAQKPWRLRALDRKQGLALQALQDGDWFEIRGQVKVDESLQLEVQRLLELTRSAQGRFIALADGQFLALTTEMKQRLLALDDLVEVHKKKVRLSRLAVSTLAELGVEGDAAFQSTLEQFQQAENYTARLPGALQAELRDYQIEGYRWMARLARAGAGCCLADDMGLGKTLQALALLVKEAKQGPHLVVCPTSVSATGSRRSVASPRPCRWSRWRGNTGHSSLPVCRRVRWPCAAIESFCRIRSISKK